MRRLFLGGEDGDFNFLQVRRVKPAVQSLFYAAGTAVVNGYFVAEQQGFSSVRILEVSWKSVPAQCLNFKLVCRITQMTRIRALLVCQG
jgi:hypothetical protein